MNKNKTPEEAREDLVVSLRECREYERYRKKHNKDGPCTSCLKAADAYGAARELKGHVDACRTGQRVTDSEPGGITMSAGDCGDCDKAEEIRKVVEQDE